jgi:hypothetical protein
MSVDTKTYDESIKRLQKIASVALRVATFPTKGAEAAVSARYTIPKGLIAELREALDDAGVDWRDFRDKHPRENR